jgi:NAD(P)H-hydrate epimerase
MIQVDKEIVKELFPLRPEGVYFKKYSFGFLLVIGGGEFYSGAPALSTMAALASGVDRVEVLAPKRAADIIASFSPNFITFPLEGIRLEKNHLSTLLTFTQSAKEVSNGNVAVLIGGGMGRSEETKKAIFEYLSQIDVPTVIDASAIFALEKNPEIIKGKPFLITPHSFEFFTLTKKQVKDLPQEEKNEIVRQEAARLETTILLKDKPDIISNGNEIALNKTGSPYMSVGGTGDTLAGICGALLSRQIDPFKAAQAAAFINGKAGELAAEELKESLLPTDLINKITKVLHL